MSTIKDKQQIEIISSPTVEFYNYLIIVDINALSPVGDLGRASFN